MTKDLSAKDIKNLSADRLFPPHAEASDMLLACPPDSYSASAIARAVEDVDAHVLNLNVTSLRLDSEAAAEPGFDAPASPLVVALRVSRRDVAAVARSLARYGYDVIDFDAPAASLSDDSARARAAELLRYLEM